jgi:hypothetical protein
MVGLYGNGEDLAKKGARIASQYVVAGMHKKIAKLDKLKVGKTGSAEGVWLF